MTEPDRWPQVGPWLGRELACDAMTLFKKLAPWLVAAAILYFLFSRVAIADAWAAARAANLALFLPMMMVGTLVWFLIDSAAFAFLFTRFNAKLEWSEARSLRGLTYLVTPINWNLGTAAVILHLRSSKKIGAVESTSTMFLYQLVDGVVLGAFGILGLLMLPLSPEIDSLRTTAFGLVGFQVLGLVLLVGTWPRWRIVERMRTLKLFRSHRRAVWPDIGLLALMKGLYFAVFIGVYWLGCHAFEIDLPLSLAAAATPLILLAGALPLTPGGLGTQQATMLYFFAPYGEQASILAFGLSLPVVLMLLRALVGLPYLKDLPKLRAAMVGADTEQPEDQPDIRPL